jgi:hypothetical protein
MVQAAQIISRSPLIGFATVGVQPPAQHYLSPDDHLFLRVWNSAAGVTVSLRYRYLAPRAGVLAGTITLTPSTDRAANFQRVPLAEGFLLSVTLATAAGTPKRGQTFCQVGIVRGGVLANEPAALLISDYLADTLLLAWPGGLLRSSVEGPGFLRSITGSDPAAGAEISETVPTNARWRLIGLTAQLFNDATVANRFAALVFDDGASIYARATFDQATTTLQAPVHSWSMGGNPSGGQTNMRTMPLAQPNALLAGQRIRTATASLQAGDNWSAPVYLVEEWIEE